MTKISKMHRNQQQQFGRGRGTLAGDVCINHLT